MAYLQSLLAPHSLNINDSNVAVKWNEWKELWLHYSIAVKVNKEAGEVQAVTILMAISPKARKVFKTWNLTAGENKDIKTVIEQFDDYCNPRKNVPFERYRFNFQQQESGWLPFWSPRMHVLAWNELANERLCWLMRCLPHSPRLVSQRTHTSARCFSTALGQGSC